MSNNYLELSKEIFLENMMLSHRPCFTWKFFMTCFHKILKLIFEKQPSCPRILCTEHWKKLSNLTAFLEFFLCLRPLIINHSFIITRPYLDFFVINAAFCLFVITDKKMKIVIKRKNLKAETQFLNMQKKTDETEIH